MQMLIICNKSTIVDSLCSSVRPSDEKREDLIVNNIQDDQFLNVCFLTFFFCCCKFPSFKGHSPKCPVDREPLSRDKVMISHGKLAIPRSTLG